MKHEKQHRRRARAAQVAADVVPAHDKREGEIEAEVADRLADLAWNDPETVFLVRCAREIEYGGYLGDYVIEAGARRTLARPDAQVSLVVAAGVSCEEALVRVNHIRAYLEELPLGAVLATDPDSGTDGVTDRLARLDAAREIVRTEMGHGAGSG